MNALADELGELLTAPKVAKMTGIDVKRVRRYYRSFGGFVLGNRIYFYSKEVKSAIQGQIKRAMDSASDEREKEILSPLRNEKRGNRVGGERKRTIADGEKRGRGSDPSISLLEWATAYLQYSQRQYVKLTFEEKRFAFKLLFKSVDPQLPVCELKTISVLKHLQGEEEKRSGN